MQGSNSSTNGTEGKIKRNNKDYLVLIALILIKLVIYALCKCMSSSLNLFPA